MDIFVRSGDTGVGKSPTSVGSATAFFNGHLASSREAGVFRFTVGYLTDDGAVRATYHDPELWRMIGVPQSDIDAGIVRPRTIAALCRGCDLHGNRLVRKVRGGFHRVAHAIWTLFPTVSHLLSQKHRELDALALMRKLNDYWHRTQQDMATRISSGGAGLDYTQRVRIEGGRTLMLSMIHGTNRLGEPHPHGHELVFSPVFCRDEEWRSFEGSAHASWMQKVGRHEMTKMVASHLALFGYELRWTPGQARDLDEDTPDADIVCPDGSIIRAGSILHQRTIELTAWREIYGQFRDRESTWAEVEHIRQILRKEPEESWTYRASFLGISLAQAIEIDRAFEIGRAHV